jgi:hypothetical protein
MTGRYALVVSETKQSEAVFRLIILYWGNNLTN